MNVILIKDAITLPMMTISDSAFQSMIIFKKEILYLEWRVRRLEISEIISLCYYYDQEEVMIE